MTAHNSTIGAVRGSVGENISRFCCYGDTGGLGARGCCYGDTGGLGARRLLLWKHLDSGIVVVVMETFRLGDRGCCYGDIYTRD